MAKKLYVGNLGFDVTDADLQQLFSPHGSILNAQVIMDRDTGRSKGFGFVQMSTDSEAQAAIDALNGKAIGGRPIVVINQARSSELQAEHGRHHDSGRDHQSSGEADSSSLVGSGVGFEDGSFGFAGSAARYPQPQDTSQAIRFVDIEVFLKDADQLRDAETLTHLQSDIVSLMEELGFEVDPDIQPSEIFGSWWHRIWFRSKAALTSDEAKSIYQEVREAARRKTLDEIGASAFSKRADSLERILARLDQFDEVAFRLGDVLIVKAVVNGKIRVLVETISPTLQRELESNPMLTRDPAQLFKALEYDPAAKGVVKEDLSRPDSHPGAF